jgi:protein-tyrosine phosphatase
MTMKLTLEIRRATIVDREIATAIVLDASRRQSAYGFANWEPETIAARVERTIADGDLYLAFDGDEALATVTLQWQDRLFWGDRPDDAGYVHLLAVSTAAAGRRVGATLLSWSEAQVIAAGREFVRLDCQSNNEAINRYYRDAGFKLIGLHAATNFNLYEKRVGDAETMH